MIICVKLLNKKRKKKKDKKIKIAHFKIGITNKPFFALMHCF